MSGIDIAEEVTASQLEALAGGELLKSEVWHCVCISIAAILCCMYMYTIIPTVQYILYIVLCVIRVLIILSTICTLSLSLSLTHSPSPLTLFSLPCVTFLLCSVHTTPKCATPRSPHSV